MKVAVPAISFCQQPELVELLRAQYPDAKVNTECVPRYHSDADVIDYLRGCEAAIVSFEPINETVLSALPELKVVSKLGVGLDRIDPRAMHDHGVRLGWTAGVNKRAVAEHALSLALACLRHLVPLNLAVREGRRPLQRLGRQLSGRTVGIHGLGNIGKELVRLLQPFECEILACDIRYDEDFNRHFGVQAVALDELLTRSEVLSIHLPVTRLTRGLYDAGLLARLRKDVVLINTARGRIVDELALREALVAGRIAAAGFDVFEREPPEDDVLLKLPGFIATPHVGASTAEARWAMGTTAIEGLRDNFLPEPGVYPFEDR